MSSLAEDKTTYEESFDASDNTTNAVTLMTDVTTAESKKTSKTHCLLPPLITS